MEKNKITKEALKRPHVEPLTPLEQWFESLLPRLFQVYGLRSFSVSYCSYTEEDAEHSPDGGTVMLAVNYQKEYHTVNLKVHSIAYEMWAAKEFDELLDALVHEVAHVITAPLAYMAMDRYVRKSEITSANEEATESIAQIARKLLRHTNPELFKRNKAKK